MLSVQIQTEPFGREQEESPISSVSTDYGAKVSFTGVVRGHDNPQRPLDHLYIEHFPSVTEQEIERIVKLAMVRWSIVGCRVIHRVGRLAVGEDIVFISVLSKRRKDAFQAAEFVMDYLKTEAPFWKKEFYCDGGAAWVAPKGSDLVQKNRWGADGAGF